MVQTRCVLEREVISITLWFLPKLKGEGRREKGEGRREMDAFLFQTQKVK